MGEKERKADGWGPDKASREQARWAGLLPSIDAAIAMVERSSNEDSTGVWTHRASKDEVSRQFVELESRRRGGARMPLFGLPCAIKDNIDVAGMPTTAACPAFAYTPRRSATVVERLVDAGAIVLGKTNLDQFATGLVGTRSPYGVPRNPFDPRYIPGGSSSGSAVAVSRGLAAFALGTDTAGSGRVPAAFNNVVGLKPSCGAISTEGVVPACRSLDCVSIFALTCADAWRVFEVTRHFDPRDPYARVWKADVTSARMREVGSFCFGVPGDEYLEFHGDDQSRALYARAVESLEGLGGNKRVVDYSPFREAARLLYGGPWVAERLVAAGALLATSAEAIEPSVRAILEGAQKHSARDVFQAQAELKLLSRRANEVLREVDVMVLPSAPTIYTADQVQEEPLRLNERLGYYTNFVNLLDLCALAVPAGFRADGLPFGITLIGPWGRDLGLARLGARFHSHTGKTLGTSVPCHTVGQAIVETRSDTDGLRLAVVGAHLSGQPLNHQLTSLGARLVQATRTAPCYRLFELPDTRPAKPGLVRTADGVAVEVEVWWIPGDGVAQFLEGVSAPLCIGCIELESGQRVHGFLCEQHAIGGAKDISSFGGWRAYRAARSGTD